MRWRSALHLAACFGAFVSVAVARAVDLSVASVEVTQGLSASVGTLPLVAKNATLVRVTVGVTGSARPQANVDAVLRIYADGVEIPESPVYSSNGPITAPLSPSSANQNDTINFLCLPPESAAVTFLVTVNPFATITETNMRNNSMLLPSRAFVCRKMVEVAYVPVNYTLGGGLPPADMIEPGVGDAFLRAVYKVGDWNYHRSPLPPPTHVLDINVSSVNMLNTLLDIRQVQLPTAGFNRPEFIYGWLPGNPYIGNGQANSTPGAAGFGNTDPVRFQRTFAHEMGHCWGQPHNQFQIGVVGYDVEQQLRDPLGVAPVMPTTKRDVMVPSLNTADAWIASSTYLDAIDDARSQCLALDGGDDAGGPPADDATTVLRLAGVHDHVMRRVALAPAMVHERVAPTVDDPSGNVLVEAFDAAGARLHAVRVNTATCRESCAQAGHFHGATSLYVNLPLAVERQAIARVLVREFRKGAVGRPLAELLRSAHAPRVTELSVAWDEAGTGPLAGRARIDWTATDADGDALVADLLYSPDGGDSWLPICVGESTGSFEFDPKHVPASEGALGRFAVRVSDGMNIGSAQSHTMRFGASQPPDVHIIGPTANDSVPQGATVLMHGSAWDIEDRLLPESSVTWTSSRDGLLGSGRLLVRRNLTAGTHVLTCRGVDSSGLASERSVTITVTPRLFNNANLDGEGTVSAADLVILLSEWDRTGVGDLDLDGIVGPRDVAALLQRWGL
jgi:hypothetical protein